ncbi:unnamed protein product, partial [Vitis vinifera]|uniref:Terpene synthase N-terminal domain-containing protein n=1 Tax=Vitis vinifera TaxID=29760 RepID=D7TL89_VITVI
MLLLEEYKKSLWNPMVLFHCPKEVATQVSACPLVQIPKPENRPRAKFHPSIWGDQFITYTPEDEVTRACKEKQLEDLKEEVRRDLMAAAGNPSQVLNFIDAVQRLGVAYHFERERRIITTYL